MKLSHFFRTTILASTLAFGLTGYTQASNAEIIQQQFQQGLQAYKQKDYATALKLWQPLAEQGYETAQYNLGIMYLNGWGVALDYQQAVYWYQQAAQQGDADAQNNLGFMYYQGQGVKEDAKKARSLWQQACKQGFKKACNVLEVTKSSKKAK
ncbi:tetratricopeptide repeat protein [Ursidibacter sp. B-7004-1]